MYVKYINLKFKHQLLKTYKSKKTLLKNKMSSTNQENENNTPNSDENENNEIPQQVGGEIPEIDAQELAVFKQNVKQWMRLDDNVRNFQKS